MSVLNSDSTKQARSDIDESFPAAARDAVEVRSGVGLHDVSFETVNEIVVGSKRSSPTCVCACKEYITELKKC